MAMNPGCPVYIVDHDSRLRQDLVRILRREGFAPVPFSCGADFIEALDFLAPGIALMELHLADMAGAALQQDLSSRRSEEHTSALQSLMRISYAVFCLTKKTKLTYTQ